MCGGGQTFLGSVSVAWCSLFILLICMQSVQIVDYIFVCQESMFYFKIPFLPLQSTELWSIRYNNH